jgi:uncharacterized protein (DUF362 family)
MPQVPAGYANVLQQSLMNQFKWSQDKSLRQWMRQSRLDAFGKMVAEVDRSDAPKMAVLDRLRANTIAAMANLPRLTVPA